MAKLHVAMLFVALLASQGLAATANIEYQGAGGDLGTAGNWYVLSNINNPASRTGETRLPVLGDTGLVRNATTTTLSSTLVAQKFYVGGPYITGQASGALTTVYVPNGGSLSLASGIYEDEGSLLAIGGTYGGVLNLNGGTVVVTNRQPSGVAVGGPNGGTLNVTGGSMHVGFGAIPIGAPQINVGGGTVGNTGVVNQSGGTVKAAGNNGSDRLVMVGHNGGFGQ